MKDVLRAVALLTPPIGPEPKFSGGMAAASPASPTPPPDWPPRPRMGEKVSEARRAEGDTGACDAGGTLKRPAAGEVDEGIGGVEAEAGLEVDPAKPTDEKPEEAL